MKLVVIKRPYTLEWSLGALFSLAFCIMPFMEGRKVSDIIIGLIFFAIVFIICVSGLLFGWKKKEAVDLEGRRCRLYSKNRKLFLLYTGFVDGISFTFIIALVQYVSERYDFYSFRIMDVVGLILLLLVFMVVGAIVNYNKYSFVDKSRNEFVE